MYRYAISHLGRQHDRVDLGSNGGCAGGRCRRAAMIKYALLGLLREHSDYGYQLKRRFDESLGSVWQLNIGQVYQALRALEQAGLIVELDTVGGGQPARRRYEPTAKGRRMLE